MSLSASSGRRAFITASLSLSALYLGVRTSSADATPQSLPFSQSWSNAGQITVNDNWTGVPGILGIRGDNLTAITGADPQTILAEQATVNVIADQASPNLLTTGGVAEFDGIPNASIALQGSGTADAPYVQFTVNSTGALRIRVEYNLRDLDASLDNAVQPVALQYRVGTTGNFTNVPGGFVSDATSGPSLATLVTPVTVVLPAEAGNQPVVQVRVITSNAVGNDEWVGVDDILITVASTPPIVEGLASPDVVDAGESTLLLATVTPGTIPASTSIQVACDLSLIGGLLVQPMFDDGTNGDALAGDNIFSYEATVALNTSTGERSLSATASDAEGRSGKATMKLTVNAVVGVPGTGSAAVLSVAPPYPNPFRSTTSIDLVLTEAMRVHVAVFDLQGRSVAVLHAPARIPAGHHHFTWTGQDAAGRRVASGVYLCRVQTEQGHVIRRLLAVD